MMTEGVRPRCRRCKAVTRGAKRKVKNTANATGMNTFCAKYKQLTKTTPTTVLAKTIKARCQAGIANAFATS